MDAQEKPNNDKLQDNEEIIDSAASKLTEEAQHISISEETNVLSTDNPLEATVVEPPAPAKRGRKKKEAVEEKEESITQEEDLKIAPVKRGRKKKEELSSEIVNEEPAVDSTQTPEKADEVKPLIDPAEAESWDMKTLVEKANDILTHDLFEKIRESMKLLINRYEVLKKQNEQPLLSDEPEPSVGQDSDQQPSDNVEFLKLTDQFQSIQSKYNKLRKQHLEKLEAEKLRNYELKKQILEDLKVLVDSEETLQKSWEDFKELQQQWKNIGQVPPALNQDLWNSFNHLVDLFLDKVKINKELRDLDYKKNLETKLDICEKIEELLLADSMDEAFRKLHELQSLWRETGPVPSDKREEINARFANTIERLKDKRREQYESFKDKMEENLQLKRALVLQMKQITEQEISTAKAWGKKTEETDELMKLWKQAGPVPKKYNEEVWTEFRSYMTTFYNEKKAFFSKMKDELTENYNRKLLLCKQSESLQDSTEWKKTSEELIALQNEWKTIGPVPHRYSDSIWKRFRQSCDTFFNRKQDFFSNMDKHEEENLKAKQELIEQINNYEFGEDSKENLSAIKDFQRRFFDIGRVPLKEKDKIHNAFQKTVDSLLDKLKISRDDKRRFDMKHKYENMGSTASGQADIKKESFNVSSKINKLENDINLWETNIGFFAKSKNAEILTREFREKIEQAKAELLILKEKQKMIRGMMK
jgi:hypothetical protein